MSRVLVVIPARYGSTRFPGKALADLGGRPLVVRVAELASRMQLAHQVIVATDDDRILAAVSEAGFACEKTGPHPTGSDRVGEVAGRHQADVVVNLQGDEPLLDPGDLDRLVAALAAESVADLATLAHGFTIADSWESPHVVKVLVDCHGYALYFSRAALPGRFPGQASGSAILAETLALRHIGVYAYRADALQRFLALPGGPLERCEGLEQLRALENGMRVKVVRTPNRPVGVDTASDLAEVRRNWGS